MFGIVPMNSTQGSAALGPNEGIVTATRMLWRPAAGGPYAHSLASRDSRLRERLPRLMRFAHVRHR